MKTKTTLAALLLAAVMVTPSYGAGRAFLAGAKEKLNDIQDKEIEDLWSLGCFSGYISAVGGSGQVGSPDGVNVGQVSEIVAKYIQEHPAERHEPEYELIRRACKEAWPEENAHVQTTKRVLRRPFGRGDVPVAKDGNR